MRREINMKNSMAIRLLSKSFLSCFVLGAFVAGSCHGIAATIVKFDPPGSVKTEPTAISPDGTIVGGYTKSTRGIGWHAFLRTPDGSINTNFNIKGARYGTNFAAINSKDVIVGSYTDRFDRERGFLRSADGTITNFNPPHSTLTNPSSINDGGMIVGCFRTDDNYGGGCVHGFIRAADGTYSEFDPQGSASTVPTSINDHGAIAGYYSTGTGPWYGFVRFSNGKFATFRIHRDYAGDIFVSGMNSKGIIAGYYDVGSYWYGFIRAVGGKRTFVDIDGSHYVQVLAIDDNGDTIGNFTTDIQHGFVRSAGGAIAIFDPKHSFDTWPDAINSSGDIAGWYWDGVRVHGFLRIP